MRVTTKRLILAKVAPLVTYLRCSHVFDQVRTFCMFIGHGRSGSTLVGSLLNAHPNIVMSNELDILYYLERGLNRQQLINLIYYMSNRIVKKGSRGGGGYSYAVPNQWQGRHRELFVIGDRKAGITALRISKNPEILDELCRVIAMDIRFINIVRNPYDNITTMFHRDPPLPGESMDSHLRRKINRYFNHCAAIRHVIKKFGADKVKQLYHEDVVLHTHEALGSACKFLGVDAPKDYLYECVGIVESSPHVTRNSINWDDVLVELVADGIKQFSWLERYSYEN